MTGKPARTLYLRFTTQADEQAVFDFYRDNPRPGVSVRKPEVWRERIAAGTVTVIHDEQGGIVACAIAYPLVRGGAGDRHMWTEIGSVLVARDNMGLFRPLMAATVMRAWLLEPPQDRFLADIVVTNNHSSHVFAKNGATPHNATQEQNDLVVGSMIRPAGAFRWVQMGAETMPQFARNLLSAVDRQDPVIDRKTGELYRLDFSRCALVSMFRSAIEQTAAHDFGNAQAPDYGRSIEDCRKKLGP